MTIFPGGNDKGRDFIYCGTSTFNPALSGNWIFQSKHKSKDLKGKELVASLADDLKKELTKVFLINGQQFDNYFLVTNKEVNANGYDSLFGIFQQFIHDYQITCQHFGIISYPALASCIDQSDSLKWSYPNIISHPDFKILVQSAMNRHLDTRRIGWLRGMQKQVDKFVHTIAFIGTCKALENSFNIASSTLSFSSNRDTFFCDQSSPSMIGPAFL